MVILMTNTIIIFLSRGGRFPAIEEDEPVKWLCAVSMNFALLMGNASADIR